MANKNNEFEVQFTADTDEYKKSMKDMASESKALVARQKLEAEQLKNTTTQAEKYEKQIKDNTEQQKLVQKQIDATNEQLRKAQEMYGVNSKEAQEYEQSLIRLQTQHAKLGNDTVAVRKKIADAAKRQAEAEEKLRLEQEKAQKEADEAAKKQEEYAKKQKHLRNALALTSMSFDDLADVIGDDMVAALKRGDATVGEMDKALAAVARQAGVASQDMVKFGNLVGRMKAGNIRATKEEIDKLTQSVEEATVETRELDGQLEGVGSTIAGLATGVGGGILAVLGLERDAENVTLGITLDERDVDIARATLDEIKDLGIDRDEALGTMAASSARLLNQTDVEWSQSLIRTANTVSMYKDINFDELHRETVEVAKQLDLGAVAASNLMYGLIDIGFPREEIDAVSEFSGQLRKAGADADTIMAILASAATSDYWQMASVLDGLKELNLVSTQYALDGIIDPEIKAAIRLIEDGTQAATEIQIAAQEKVHAETLSITEATHAEVEAETAKSQEKQTKIQEKAHQKQTESLQKSHEKQQKTFEKYADKRRKALDDEYLAKLRTVDAEEYNRLKALDAQISGIEKAQEAEDKLREQQELREQRESLLEDVAGASTLEEYHDAVKALADFEDDVATQKRREQREAQKEQLEVQKSDVEAQAEMRRTQIEEEKALKEAALEDELTYQNELLTAKQTAETAALTERQTAEKEAMAENHALAMANLQALHAQKMADLEAEQAALIAHMTDPALSDKAQKALDDYLTAMVKVANGDITGMEYIGKYLEESESKSRVGFEILGFRTMGTPFEDSGAAIIQTLMGVQEAMTKVAEQKQKMDDIMSGDESALKDTKDAATDLTVALTDLLTTITNIIQSVAQWVSANPDLAAMVVTVTMITGALLIVVKAVSTIWGVISGLWTFLIPLGKKLLDFILLLSPHGKVIMGIMAIIGVIWTFRDECLWVLGLVGDAFGTFFEDLGISIKDTIDTFGLFFSSIGTFFADLFTGVWDFVGVVFSWIIEKLAIVEDKISTFAELLGGLFVAVVTLPLNGILAIYNGIAGLINKIDIDIPDWIPVIGGNNWQPNLPIVDYFADGGVMTRATVFGGSAERVYVGGEAGREAILPLRADVLAGIGVGIAQASGFNQQQPVNIEQMIGTVHIHNDTDVQDLMVKIEKEMGKLTRGRY